MPCSSKHTAVVTGGGGGIGRAIAAALAKQGTKVAVSDLRQDQADAAAADLRAAGREAIAITLDVTDPGSIAAGAATIAERRGCGRHRR